MNPVFTPDYAIPPGATLRGTLAVQGTTQPAAARTLGLSLSQFRARLSGQRELTAEFASRLEILTGTPAVFWNQAQSSYALHKMRLLRASLSVRPRTPTERHQCRALMRQAALATANDLRDFPESRVPDLMDLVE
jgi:plasmid maintenance system antidote protein VapI